MKFNFGTKAQTLLALNGFLKSAKIPESLFFTLKNWNDNKKSVLYSINKNLGNVPYIVRSSSTLEDSFQNSKAGQYTTVLEVTSNDLEISINEVFQSYESNDLKQEVLVQPMLKNVLCSGVAFSHDPNSFSPYRIINWSESDKTTVITGGGHGNTWTQAAKCELTVPTFIKRVIELIEELLEKFNNTPIDIEFAFTSESDQETLWLLQVRPLILKDKPESVEEQSKRLNLINLRLNDLMRPKPFLLGEKTLFGVMPDWNPAEIIGLKPKPLALSLYRELVTDSIWAYQRHNYGYRNLRSFPLLVNFFGVPYVDVRLSFNSFIPSSLNENIAGKLADYYIKSLVDNPHLHDKIEFEIVYSCFTLDLPDRIQVLKNYDFKQEEIESILSSLRSLTNSIVDPQKGLWIKDSERIVELGKRRERILTSDLDTIDRVYWLIEDVKRYGTLPFAGLARVGFIAVQILRSLVNIGVFSEEDSDNFLSSINTVAKQMNKDKKILDRTTFLSKYGHLRPGTYDILSPRYDENPDQYFNWDEKVHQSEDAYEQVRFTLPQMRELSNILRINSLHTDPIELLSFLKSAIELREFAKFEFSKNLSDAISLMRHVGGQFDIEADDLAFTNYHIFKELYVGTSDPKNAILQNITEGKALYSEGEKLNLPPLIIKPDDIWGFKSPDISPNFITKKKATADVVAKILDKHIENKIVCIISADPGFDWIFDHSIAGLITAWGGSNSHMAIRAGELGIPAVIGAGENLYQLWSSSNRLTINCAEKRVDIIS